MKRKQNEFLFCLLCVSQRPIRLSRDSGERVLDMKTVLPAMDRETERQINKQK